MKLNRLIGKHRFLGRTQAQVAITQRRVRVDGVIVCDGQHRVDRFTTVTLDEELVQQAESALYLMLHKPVGYLSATRDAVHPTVMDLIDLDEKQSLHLAGRLDRATSGLVLLSNDGRWTESITSPQSSVRKVYRVETVEPMKESDVAAFAAGFYFHTERITTLPCELEILEDHRARVTLQEGRYHQIKRMFHRVGNRVKSLHRERIGSLSLPPELAPGSWRRLTEREVKSFGDG
jgi:16S rRNA pseudouridine516 synthase